MHKPAIMEHIVSGNRYLRVSGDWVIDVALDLDRLIHGFAARGAYKTEICCEELGRLDTTGAVLIRRLAAHTATDEACGLINIQPDHRQLLDVITDKPDPVPTEPEKSAWYIELLLELGLFVEGVANTAGQLVGFLGMVLSRLFGAVRDPKRIRFIPLLHQIDMIGVRSMGIVGLISFLVGAVMVNQGAIQLAIFGAEIFVIDMIGILQLREMSVLLTSIIIAGRSGSAFTAQIGSMKLREEVDAMVTLGMNPIDVLVLPRLLALVLCLPLLTFYADIVGILGGMMMAWVQLDITPPNFLSYFHQVIILDHFLVGLIKAPVFAAVIAVTGCYQGLTVRGSAESLGDNTTRSVVQAIFLVIALDALFAIFFTAINM